MVSKENVNVITTNTTSTVFYCINNTINHNLCTIWKNTWICPDLAFMPAASLSLPKQRWTRRNMKNWSARWPNKGAEDAEMKIKGGFVSSMNSEEDVKAVGRVTTANSNLYGEYKDAEGPWEMYVDQVTYYSHLLAYDTDALASHMLWMNGSAYAE